MIFKRIFDRKGSERLRRLSNTRDREAIPATPTNGIRAIAWRFALRLLVTLATVLFMPVSVVSAQSITLSPTGYLTTGTGGQTQFIATVTGLAKTDVNWSVEYAIGGNTTYGTISTSGLYTAPAVIPGQNPVMITATSKIQSSVSATTYICILPSGPTLTAVTPNPLPTGAITVVLTGSGFLPGATVTETYNGGPLNLSTISVTPTTITASTWQGAEASTTFTEDKRIHAPG